MPRRKPTDKADVIGNFRLGPEVAFDDYRKSKQHDKFFIKPPNEQCLAISNEDIFIHNQQEHNEMLKEQEDLEEHQKVQMAIQADRIKQLCHDHLHLRKRFCEVNSFIKECSDKCKIGEKKIDNEIKEQEKLKADTAKAKNATIELTQFRDVLKDSMDAYKFYEDILNDVVEKSNIFETVDDCISRCDALMLTQVEIFRMNQEKLIEIDDMRKYMQNITDKAMLEIVGIKNELAELERAYNAAYLETMKYEKLISKIQSVTSKRDDDSNRAVHGVHHIYGMLCKRRNIPISLQQHEVEKELEFIRGEFEILTTVVNEYERQKRRPS